MSIVDDEKYLTVKEAALKIGVKEWQIHRAISRGLIPAYTFSTKRMLVRESEIRASIENSRIGSAP